MSFRMAISRSTCRKRKKERKEGKLIILVCDSKYLWNTLMALKKYFLKLHSSLMDVMQVLTTHEIFNIGAQSTKTIWCQGLNNEEDNVRTQRESTEEWKGRVHSRKIKTETARSGGNKRLTGSARAHVQPGSLSPCQGLREQRHVYHLLRSCSCHNATTHQLI